MVSCIFPSVLFATCISLSFAALCQDVDTQACHLMAAKRSDVCSDPCLSKLCPRYCNQCGLTCYTCDQIVDPTQCTSTASCPTKDHFCYVTQTFAKDFTVVYRMGCAMRDTCQGYLGPDHRKKNIDVNGACCQYNQCNNKEPLLIITADASTTTAQPTVSGGFITQTLDTCQNIDDVACSRFISANASLCSDDCFTSMCPGACGKCLKCYDCSNIESTTGCHNTTTCNPGRECYVMESLTEQLKPVFRLGCMEKQLCSRFTASSIGNIFGRRDNFILKGSCCNSDLCNDHLNQIPQGTQQPQTQVPQGTQQPLQVCTGSYAQQNHTVCPVGYAETSNSCYMIGQDRGSWDEAKAYCENHCGRLVDFADINEMEAVIKLFLPHRSGQALDEDFWTDARYINGEWVWSHNGALINDQDFDEITNKNPRTHTCGTADLGTDDDDSLIEDLTNVRCDEDFFPLCEAPKI